MSHRSLGGPDATLELPAGLAPSARTVVPPDVGRLPGARLVLFETAQLEGGELLVGCARAPSDRWVPGLEAIVLERALGMILAHEPGRPQLSRLAAPAPDGVFAAERWGGVTADGRSLDVRALLAFVGPEADALACAASCVGSETCPAAIDGVTLRGALGPPPPPGLLARTALAAAERPVAALCLAALLGALVVAALLGTRPRLRPTARRAAGRARSPRSSPPRGTPPPR